MSAFFMIVAFLKWEAAYATLPGDVSGQVTAFLQLFGTGWFPVVVMLLLGVVLFGLGLGPDRLEAWVEWVASRRANQSERPPASENEGSPAPENKQPKTENRQRRKWFKPTSSTDRSRQQETSVDLKEHNDRVALKVLLAKAEEEGRQLCQGDPSFQEAQQWWNHTYNLIDAATLGGVADYFLKDEGLEPPDDSLSAPQRCIQLRIQRIVAIKDYADSLSMRHAWRRGEWIDN